MKRFLRLSFSALIILIIAIAFAALYFSFLDYADVKSRLDSVSTDHNVISFTVLRFHLIARKVRLVGCFLFVIAIALLLYRKKILDRLSEVVIAVRAYIKFIFHRIRFAIQNENRFHLLALSLIFLTGFLIKLYHLFQPISYDEAFTYLYFVNRPLWVGLSDYSYPNNHLFHTLLSHFSTSIFGNALWAIRLPAFIAGVLLAPATYLSGRKLFNKNTALIASALIAVNNTITEHSVMARGYTMISLIFLMLIFLALEIRNENKKGARFFFILFSVLGLYTIPVFVLPLLILLVYNLIYPEQNKKRNWENLFAWVVIPLMTALIYLPVLLASGAHSLVANDYIKSHNFSSLINEAPLFFKSIYNTWMRAIPLSLALILFSGLLLSFFSSKSKELRKLVLITIIILIILILVQRVIPPVRTFIYLLPLFFLFCSNGIIFLIEKLSEKRKDLSATILTLAFLFFLGYKALTLKPLHWDEISDNENITLFLKNKLIPGDKVLAALPIDYPLEYYFRRQSMSTDYFFSNSTNFSRLIVVVNEGSKQRLDNLILNPKLKGIALCEPTLLSQFEYSKVYLLEKK